MSASFMMSADHAEMEAARILVQMSKSSNEYKERENKRLELRIIWGKQRGRFPSALPFNN